MMPITRHGTVYNVSSLPQGEFSNCDNSNQTRMTRGLRHGEFADCIVYIRVCEGSQNAASVEVTCIGGGGGRCEEEPGRINYRLA